MDKKEVQKRVLQNGKPLALNKFVWNKKTKTFSTVEHSLVLDFSEQSGCTFNTGDDCTFKTWSGCTFNTGYDCTFNTGYGCTFKTWSGCTFNTWGNCTFNTGYDCTFKTGYDCTFNTGYDCTFKTWSGCTFNTGEHCVILRRDIHAVIESGKEVPLTLCPPRINGYISNGIYSETGKPAIIADGILSEVLSKKVKDSTVVYSVINHGEKEKSFLIEADGVFSHGRTLREAKDSFMYKISSRDTSQYKDLTLDSILTRAEAIKLYRVLTGACESGTRNFVETHETPSKLSVKEMIKITEGQFNHNALVSFFKEAR
jgi:hypothetical protein